MNERIKQLAEQAWVYQVRVYQDNGVRTYGEQEKVFDKEKFAELIVRMCADAADMARDVADCDYVGDYVAEYMGFGEEEGVTEWRAK